jgi:glycosyltransferase involved in cell wall biosynthesis
LRVSILIPTFNRAEFLKAAITSALAQDYHNLEILISDNASSDETSQVVQPFLADPRVKYFRNETNIGMVRNWHKATFERSTGDWFLLLSDDDILINPSFISQAVDIIQTGRNVAVVYSSSYVYDQHLNTVSKLEIPFKTVENGPFVFSKRGTVLPQDFALCNVLFNKTLAAEIGAFQNPNNLACDTELFLHLCLRGNVGVVKQYSSIYRLHSGNLLKSVNTNPDLLEGGLEAFVSPLIEAVKRKISPVLIQEFISNVRLRREVSACILKMAAVDPTRARSLLIKLRERLQGLADEILPSEMLSKTMIATAGILAPVLVLRRRLISLSKLMKRNIVGRDEFFEPLQQKVYLVDSPDAKQAHVLGNIRLKPSKNKKPLVGIALATYEPDLVFFEQQIASLIRQTYREWICVVVDDCSSQKSFDAIQTIIGKDPRFIIYRNESNLGSFRSFEKAIGYLPPCEFVSFCDQDDIWQDYKLEFLVSLLKQPEISFVHSDQALIDKNGDVLAGSCWDAEGRYVPSIGTGLLLFRNTVSGCAVMFKSEVLGTALPFPDIPMKQQPYYHDVWIAMHACLYGQGMAIKEPLVLYRQHDNNQVGAGFHGRGMHLPSLIGRSIRLYQSRLKLRNDFVYSLSQKNQLNENISEAVNFTDSFWALIYRCIHYSLPNPKFFKTGILLVVGYVFSRVKSFATALRR